MFERIVIGFDESEGSRDALAFGKRLSDELGAELILAGVVPPAGGSFVPALPADAFTQLAEQTKVGLEREAEKVGAKAEIVESRSAARGLDELIEKLGGDLLVLGCTGAEPGIARAGHKTRALMQGSRCAVALAPVGYRDSDLGLSVIGAAVDGSPESDAALIAASEIGEGAELRVISVATDFAETWSFWGATYALSELADASREAAQKCLDDALAALPDGVEAKPVMVEGMAAEELRRQAKGLDLLCLGSRGYGPVLRVLLGSVTSDLLREVSCPVLVLPRGAGQSTAG